METVTPQDHADPQDENQLALAILDGMFPLVPTVDVPLGPLTSPVPNFGASAAADSSPICANCAARGHLKRNCPEVTCRGCGNRGHFRQDCPNDSVAKRVRPGDDAIVPIEEVYRWSVCRSCGSNRHLQANCPARFLALECYQCHQRGHMMTTCPQTRCYNCGTYGHSSQICQSKSHCFHCSHAGHKSNDCPMKSKGRVCYQCKEPGHEAAKCPQGILCRMCHQKGHVVAHCPEVVCDACHEKGHTSGVCSTKDRCDVCGGPHESHCCDLQNSTPSTRLNSPRQQPQPAAEQLGSDEDPAVAVLSPSLLPQTVMHPYIPNGKPRTGRVAIIIDGPYFERCVQGNTQRTAEQYRSTVNALRYTMDFLGDIFAMDPIAYWFDTDPTAFSEFLETAMPLAHRERAFHDAALRRAHLTDEMNGGRSLHNVVAKLVGGMKRQRGYTQDGPGHVWVQTGVDVAISTCLVELCQDQRQFQQVVLLCGDSDIYPAVKYCNEQRFKIVEQEARGKPVRICGTSTSIARTYGEHQDLSDFLPRILLDAPVHTENGLSFEFPTSGSFK